MFRSITSKLSIFRNIINFNNSEKILLGRWNIKHNQKDCEIYLQNYYADPGYPNELKDKWIEIENIKNQNKTKA